MNGKWTGPFQDLWKYAIRQTSMCAIINMISLIIPPSEWDWTYIKSRENYIEVKLVDNVKCQTSRRPEVKATVCVCYFTLRQLQSENVPVLNCGQLILHVDFSSHTCAVFVELAFMLYLISKETWSVCTLSVCTAVRNFVQSIRRGKHRYFESNGYVLACMLASYSNVY